MGLIYHSMLLNVPELNDAGLLDRTSYFVYSDNRVSFNEGTYVQKHSTSDLAIIDSGTWSVMLQSSFDSGQMIIDQRSSNIGIQPIYISEDRKIQFHTSDGGSVDIPASDYLKTNEWVHVAVVLAHNRVYVYVDGTLLNEGGTPHYTKGFSSLPLWIGRRHQDISNSTYYYYKGSMKDVRIYNNALSSEEIKQISNALIAHYSFDGDSIRDNSDFKLNPVNWSASLTTDSNIGSGCAQFNSENKNFVALPKEVKRSGSLSYNIWAYMDNWEEFAEKDMRILSCTETGGYNIEPSETSSDGKFRFAVYDSGIPDYNNITTKKYCKDLTTGWHMFTFTFEYTGFSRSNAIAYIDAERQGDTIVNSNYIQYNSNNTLFLGAEAGTSDSQPDNNLGFFSGKISDFRLYARVLSEAEIVDLYKCRAKVYKGTNIFTTNELKEDDVDSPLLDSSGILTSKNIVENHYITTDDGAKFLQIFAHDVSLNTECFTTADVKDSTGPNRFSRLYHFNDDRFKNSDGKYELLLKYPGAVNIPLEYQRVEYIKSNGNKVDVKYSGKSYVYWHDIQFNDTSVRQLMGFKGNKGSYWGKTTSNNYEIELTDTGVPATSRAIVKFNCSNTQKDSETGEVKKDPQTGKPLLQSSLIVNGDCVHTSDAEETEGNYFLFGLNSDNPEFNCDCTLYRFTVYDSDPDTTNRAGRVADYFPCVRLSDGMVGLYDVMKRIFIYNSGFSAGPYVDDSLYNRWKQAHNPLVTSTPTGYESVPLNIQLPNYWTYSGLGLTSSTNNANSYALLECMLGDDYWFGAVGGYKLYQNVGFPAPNGVTLKNTELYIRIDNTSFNDVSYIKTDAVQMDEFIEE